MRILVVEDDIMLAKAIVKTLEKSNYSADSVHNGEDALSYIGTNNYDAVILDLTLPRLDGMSVLKTVRASKNNIPILILSARNSVEDKILGLDSGANDYMTKPFDYRELISRIRVITRSHGVVDTKVYCGNLSLDKATFRLATENGSVRLANKEFQILEILFKNPSHIVSSEVFMERIWGDETHSELNVIWVYISYLRKKMADLGANVRIKAVRNAGYTIEPVE